MNKLISPTELLNSKIDPSSLIGIVILIIILYLGYRLWKYYGWLWENRIKFKPKKKNKKEN